MFRITRCHPAVLDSIPGRVPQVSEGTRRLIRHQDQDNLDQPKESNEQGFPAEAKTPAGHQLISLSDVMQRTSMGRTSIYMLIKDGTFPSAVKIGSSSRWVASEINDWIQRLMQARKGNAWPGTH